MMSFAVLFAAAREMVVMTCLSGVIILIRRPFCAIVKLDPWPISLISVVSGFVWSTSTVRCTSLTAALLRFLVKAALLIYFFFGVIVNFGLIISEHDRLRRYPALARDMFWTVPPVFDESWMLRVLLQNLVLRSFRDEFKLLAVAKTTSLTMLVIYSASKCQVVVGKGHLRALLIASLYIKMRLSRLRQVVSNIIVDHSCYLLHHQITCPCLCFDFSWDSALVQICKGHGEGTRILAFGIRAHNWLRWSMKASLLLMQASIMRRDCLFIELREA